MTRCCNAVSLKHIFRGSQFSCQVVFACNIHIWFIHLLSRTWVLMTSQWFVLIFANAFAIRDTIRIQKYGTGRKMWAKTISTTIHRVSNAKGNIKHAFPFNISQCAAKKKTKWSSTDDGIMIDILVGRVQSLVWNPIIQERDWYISYNRQFW